VKRRGFTLIELMVVIAIIIILAAIAIPNYLNMTKRAKNSRLQSDFATMATCLETFKTDWGLYPTATTAEDVSLPASIVTCSLSGLGANGVLNVANKTNAIGETNPASEPFIEYLKLGAMTSMKNPFDNTIPILYHSADGTKWIISVNTGTNNTLPFMYRTSEQSNVSFVTTLPTGY